MNAVVSELSQRGAAAKAVCIDAVLTNRCAETFSGNKQIQLVSVTPDS